MPAYKDETRNNWYCAFYFEDWNGERKKKTKRGFETKKAAQDWERQFLLQRAADTDMCFDKFVEQYIADRKDRLRENTWLTKEHIIKVHVPVRCGILLEQPLDRHIHLCLGCLVHFQQMLRQGVFNIHSPVHGFAVLPKIAPAQLAIFPEFYIIRGIEGEVGIEIVAFPGVGDFHDIPSFDCAL